MAALLERRWQLQVLFAALLGAVRFGEFAEAVEGISPRMLTERLRDLEQAGLLQRIETPASPPQVEYHLSQRGLRMAPLLEAVEAWSVECGGPQQREVEIELEIEFELAPQAQIQPQPPGQA